ncbi:TPA: ABC transporter substrate-binding protein [Haemophilus influenzae]|uniref:ABC transporter substrate-binding protein n=1 Tax=Haemophilus TaxID=724 RepID=UPI000045E949|nr:MULTISPECIES: ABC transporter substrate-binding protein [Haemophilus]ADO96512.1 Peptide ABC transporter system, periplasmic binding protein SapA [Haemophilus influenzae R2846]MCK8818275.1 ABC transporter substrate-binding protein [Haemophilus influenzae]MCK8996063.1 ABC transporter substrate-binding protein [Haemophilus influenzae]OFK52799.1 peptide ABC transporter substrate-binding protein [Haemophilus sp. HMSC066A11]TBV20427.1 peptide ABC transporter substrate-binding protein [Haemophilus
MLRLNLRFLSFLLCIIQSVELQAAPSVPTFLTENGLTYCTHASGFSFNPQTADAGTSMNVVTEQIYNKLFDIKNHSATLTPMLAQSYSISADGKEILLNLRHGVKFHQTPWFTPTRDFNAEDVVFSINRVLGHNTYLPTLAEANVTYSNPQYKVFHEQARKVRFPYFDSIKLNEKIKSVTALSPYQVKIELFEPDSSILSHLASQYAIIFSQEYAYQLSADDNLTQLDTHPVGTGPYQVKDYVYNQYVRLVRNENYWKKEAKIQNIIVDLSTDRNGRLVKFFNNECQIASYPEVSQIGLLKSNDKHYYMQSTDGMNLAYLAFNFEKPLMQDRTIREAISQSLNRARIIHNIYHNTATVANNIIPEVSWASSVNTPEFEFDYNPKIAKNKLADKNLLLNLWVINEEQVYNPAPFKMAEMIKWDLAQAGVKVKVRAVTRPFLTAQLRNQSENYDLILSGWLAGNLDPDGFMRPILSCGTKNELTNLSNWCNEEFDQFMDRAITTSHLSSRVKAYNEAQELVLRELPIIPIANVKRILVANSRVKGVKMTPFGSLDFSTLYFIQEKH